MNLRSTPQTVAVIFGLIVTAVTAFGLYQVHSKIYFPIDQETLRITLKTSQEHAG